MAQSIAIWYAAGGVYHNHYMWYAGNHIENIAGCSIPNLYQDGANLRFDGLPNEPKHTHLSRLYTTLAQHNKIILTQDGKSPEIVVGNNTLYYAVFNEQCNASQTKQQFTIDNNGVIYNQLLGKSFCITSDNRQNIFGSDELQLLDCIGDDTQQWTFDIINGGMIKNKKYATCIAGQPNPIVEEGGCGNNADWNLNLWKYDSKTMLIKSL